MSVCCSATPAARVSSKGLGVWTAVRNMGSSRRFSFACRSGCLPSHSCSLGPMTRAPAQLAAVPPSSGLFLPLPVPPRGVFTCRAHSVLTSRAPLSGGAQRAVPRLLGGLSESRQGQLIYSVVAGGCGEGGDKNGGSVDRQTLPMHGSTTLVHPLTKAACTYIYCGLLSINI